MFYIPGNKKLSEDELKLTYSKEDLNTHESAVGFNLSRILEIAYGHIQSRQSIVRADLAGVSIMDIFEHLDVEKKGNLTIGQVE